MNEIAFPGLGLGPFTIDSTAFSVFGYEIKWYGIIICLGMILAYTYAWTRSKYEGIKTDDLLDLALALMIFGIAGARVYYIIFELDSFVATGGTFFTNLWSTVVNMVSLHNGGLAIFGGIIAGFFTAMIVARIKKIRFPILLDVLAPSVMIGQMIGRWGNFTNAEAYGGETTLPWRMSITKVLTSGFKSTPIEVHPTFLYESLWNLIGFVIVATFYKKKKFHGQWLCFYLAWYGLGRAFIEGLRADSLMIGPLRVSQVLAALVCVAGVVLLTLGLIKSAKKEVK